MWNWRVLLDLRFKKIHYYKNENTEYRFGSQMRYNYENRMQERQV